MGRARKVLDFNKRHFTKSEIEERLAAEKSFKRERDQLIPPDSLSERAKQEFSRVVEEAYWLDNLDRNDLILYCFYWDKALALVESYDSCPEIPVGNSVSNSLRKALREYHSEMRAISLKLGIASIDRLKLAAPKVEKPKNKFLELANG